jgi:hypothetical protein
MGINVNKKISEGNKARKKLKAIPEALFEMEPCAILFQKNNETSYKGTPSKKGRVIFFAQDTIRNPRFFIPLKLNKPVAMN